MKPSKQKPAEKKHPMDGELCAYCGYLYGLHRKDDLSCPTGFDNHGYSHDWIETTFKSKCCGGSDYHEFRCLGHKKMRELGIQMGVKLRPEDETINSRNIAIRKMLLAKTKEELVDWIMDGKNYTQLVEEYDANRP